MDSPTIRIASLIDDSIVDGPGIRFTVFTQGCPHHCEGCHNPQTHDPNGGHLETIENIISKIKKNPLLCGVTISGGEPFYQKESLLTLVKEIKKLNFDIIVYTGYVYETLLAMNDATINEILDNIDYLIDGPFILKQRDLTLYFKGSQNQRFIDIKKSKEENKVVLFHE